MAHPGGRPSEDMTEREQSSQFVSDVVVVVVVVGCCVRNACFFLLCLFHSVVRGE
jgi:hypothetical protein